MSQIPPLGYVIVQTTQTQRDMAVEKERQLRKAREHEKDIAEQEDTFEHHVESSKEVHPVNDENEKKQSKRKHPKGHGADDEGDEDDTSHLDLTA